MRTKKVENTAVEIELTPKILAAAKKQATKTGETLDQFVTRAVRSGIRKDKDDRSFPDGWLPMMFSPEMIARCKEASKTCDCGYNRAAELLLDYALELHEEGRIRVKINTYEEATAAWEARKSKPIAKV